MKRFTLSTLFILLVKGSLIFSTFFQAGETPVLEYIEEITGDLKKPRLRGVDCIYVINLDTRPEKWIRTKKLFNHQGIVCNRVSAVDGRKFHTSSIDRMHGPYINRRRLGPGQLGCLLSHLSILNDALTRGYTVIWICEDDIYFKSKARVLPQYLDRLNKIDPKWDVFYTDLDSRVGKRILKCDYQDPRPGQILPPLKSMMKRKAVSKEILRVGMRFGTHSYFLSQRGIKKLINYFKHVYLWAPIDVDMHYVPGIREYCPSKDMVIAGVYGEGTDTGSLTQ